MTNQTQTSARWLVGALLLLWAASSISQPLDATAATELERVARERYAADDLAGAATTYLELAQRSVEPPDRGRFAVLAAWIYHQNGTEADRDQALRLAARSDPELRPDPSAYSADFLQRLQAVRIEEESSLARTVASLADRANAAVQRNDHALAIDLYRQLMELQPTRHAIRLQLAVTELNAGRAQDAAATLQPLHRDPELLDPEVQQRTASLMAMARIRGGQLDGIAADIQRVTGKLQQQLWLELALRFEEDERWDEAIDAYGSVLEIDPADRETAILRSKLLARLGRHRDAETFLINLSETLPESNAVWYELGVIREAIDDDLGAASAYRKSVSSDAADPIDEDGRVNAFVASAQLNRDRDASNAQGLIEQALAEYPQRYEPRAMYSRLLSDKGRYADAVNAATMALELAPGRPDLRNLLGNSHYLAGSYREAAAVFEDLLKDHPELTAVADNLALARKMSAQPRPSDSGPGTSDPAGEATSEPTTEASTGTIAPTQPVVAPTVAAQAGSTTSSDSPIERDLGLEAAPYRWTQTGRTVVRVDAVAEGTKADRCGLRSGDLIIRIQGLATDSLGKVEAALQGDTTGRRLDIVRNEQPMALVCI